MNVASILLERLAGAADGLARGGYLLVQGGEGFDDLPDHVGLSSGVRCRVVRADSELEIRFALWEAGSSPLVLVVPESLAIPADLRSCAERRRVHALSGDEVLSAMLGTRVTGVDDEDLRGLAVEYVDLVTARLQSRTTPTVIDRALLERTLVEVVAELHDLRELASAPGKLLAKWVRAAPSWSPVIQRLAGSALEAQLGDPGRILGWALAEGRERLVALLVHGALLSVEGEVPQSAWGPLAALQRDDGPLRAPSLARAHVVELARLTILELGPVARSMLEPADIKARRLLTGRSLPTSPLLPLAFDERAQEVARQLARGDAAGAESLRRLHAHALAAASGRELGLLEDMARLARYLNHPRAEPASPSQTAAAYLTDHAMADYRARRIDRALASVPTHHAEARALLSRYRESRDRLNRRFADQLVADYAGALFDPGVVALQNIVRDEIVARRSQTGAGGADRVFLLVLDGCSMPVFLEILEQLTTSHNRIGLEPRGAGQPLRIRPGLAPLPTITSHARGALFLGAIPKDPYAAEMLWRESGERATDSGRFRQNAALGGVARQLFLKGDLGDGGLELQAALRGPIPVVAAVFNAVDDRIGSHDTGAAWRMQVEDITGLLPALNTALDNGRHVLLTADHGHTPFRGTEHRVGAGSTPRYVRLRENEPVPDGFVVIDCGALAGEPGPTAFAWKSSAYRGQVQVGFHGGCSLEEMVVPVAWLARDGLGMDPPAWWFDAGTPPAGLPVPEPALGPVSSFAVNLPLPLRAAPAPVQRLPAHLRAVLDDEQQRAVAWILVDGPIRTKILAQRLNRPLVRVSGWLVKLHRLLAEHGAGITAETLPDQEQQWRYQGPSEST